MSRSPEVWTSHYKNSESEEGCAVGIDLGTTNSCVSVWIPEKGRAKSLREVNDGRKSSKTLPSVVYLGKGGRILAVGDEALRMAFDSKKEKGCLVSSIKRLIGRDKDDKDMIERLDGLPYDVVERSSTAPEDANIAVKVKGDKGMSVSVTPEEISSSIIARLKLRAEKYLKRKVTKAIITVPAYFNENQRSATKTAGELAGLTVLRTLTEPMAAATSYGLSVAGTKKVAVIDLGGGTLDVSIMQISDCKFETIALGGDNSLGGDDIDIKIVDYFLNVATDGKYGDLSSLDPQDKMKLKIACEKAKIELSTSDSAKIIWKKEEVMITRSQLGKLMVGILARCKNIILETLKSAKLEPCNLDEVVLVGLATKTPAFRKIVRKLFPSVELCVSVNPDLAVSQGAAIQAALMTGADEYKLKKILMLDALPYSVGLEGSNGLFQVLLPRNSKIPVRETRRFYTCQDYQPAISIDIYEGEEKLARDNHWIGYNDFVVPGGKKFKAGERSMNVTFEISADGILSVNAQVPNEEGDISETGSMSEALRMALLTGVLFVLMALYAALRVYGPLLHNQKEL